MKGTRKIGYYKDLSCNKNLSKFDEKIWDIYIKSWILITLNYLV